MQKGIFITSTDTDVGKTVFTAGLLQLLKSNSIDVVPAKPIQTGCTMVKNSIIIPDLEYSLSFVDKFPKNTKKLMSTYCYEHACSPHLAAKITGTYSSISKINKNLQLLNTIHKYILVEGAGGVLVPINRDEMMIDLIKSTELPVIIVAKAGLGTINHTLMTIRSLQNASIEIFGIYLNNTVPETTADEYIRKDNIKTIENYGKVKVIGSLKYITAPITPKSLSKLFEESIFSKNYIMRYFDE